MPPSVSSSSDPNGNDDNVHQLEEDHVIDDVDDPTSPSGGHHVTCSAVFIVGDSSVRTTAEIAVCTPGRSRVRHLYTSVGHQVSLYMTDGGDDDQHQQHNHDDEHHLPDVTRTSPYARFMISYEGKYFGLTVKLKIFA